jgi:hypothetical protein
MSHAEPEKMEGVEHDLINEDEKRVLEVYDRLESLQLEIALLRAQGVLSKGAYHFLYIQDID